MAYGDYNGPNKPDKGKEGGSCNRTRCQSSPALWYNHGSYAWYCQDCRNQIHDAVGQRHWAKDFPNAGHPMFETREMIDARELPTVSISCGPILQYRPHEFDDWGMIRNADGSMFASVRRPASEEELSEHRRAGTDPYEDLARRLMSTFEIETQPAEHMTVKPLEWTAGSTTQKWIATVFGRPFYEVGFYREEWYWMHNASGLHKMAVSSFEAGKAAAQEHYHIGILSALSAQAPVDQPLEPGESYNAALTNFKEYFVRNYPGPHTIIFDPNWHAPKLFRAAMNAVREANEAEGRAITRQRKIEECDE